MIETVQQFEHQGKDDEHDGKMKDQRVKPPDRQEEKWNLVRPEERQGQKQYAGKKQDQNQRRTPDQTYRVVQNITPWTKKKFFALWKSLYSNGW